ncbi:MAG: type IV pilus biogenesis/stability protein PilW [Granulosicoccus sp.]|nr:type IV pilus biogenesis/stability protein PilW [Granulosicoccus sp.]
MLSQGCALFDGSGAKQTQNAAQYNAQLGAQYLNRGELDQARDKLLKALEQDDDNALAHVTFAQLQSQIEKPKEAKHHFKRALEIEPDKPEHRNSYGIYLCEVKDYEQAKKQFRAAADNPYYDTPEFALDNAGLCMLDADYLSEAEEFLREALRVNPKFANAYLHMADLMHRKQRLTVADAYYQRFKSYGPETAESLWLGIKIMNDSGQAKAAERYAGRLLNQFPGSKEAGEYLSLPSR